MKDQRLHIQIAGANRIITIVDDHSGINSSTIKYARATYGKTTDTTPEPSPWNTPTTYTINTNNKVTFSIPKGSEWYTWVKVKDKAGNESIVSLEFGEDPQIKVSNTYGGRWAPNAVYKDYPGTEIDANIMMIVYGYYGAIEYEISGLSTLSEVYYLLSESKQQPVDIIKAISSSTKINCGTGETRKVTLSIKNWGSETAKYLYIVVKKSNGTYVIGGNQIMSYNIQVEAVNGTYINAETTNAAKSSSTKIELKQVVFSGVENTSTNFSNYTISATLGGDNISIDSKTNNSPQTGLITINVNASAWTWWGSVSKDLTITIKNNITNKSWSNTIKLTSE